MAKVHQTTSPILLLIASCLFLLSKSLLACFPPQCSLPLSSPSPRTTPRAARERVAQGCSREHGLCASSGKAPLFAPMGGTEKVAVDEKAGQCNRSDFQFLALLRKLCPHEIQNGPQTNARPRIITLGQGGLVQREQVLRKTFPALASSCEHVLVVYLKEMKCCHLCGMAPRFLSVLVKVPSGFAQGL